MVPVSDILEEAQTIIGNSRRDFLFKRITDSVELLANKGDFDPTEGYLDICVSNKLIALPPDVEVVKAVNFVGLPAVARDRCYMFHLNGPGQCGPSIPWEWYDMGRACTYRELVKPSKLLGYCAEDADVNCELWVYGYDENQNIIRTEVDGEMVDGWKVPVFKTTPALPADAPIFSRITRVRKDETKGPVRLSTVDNDDLTGTLLGVYQWNETEPLYRRILISNKVPWVTIYFRRKTFKVLHETDLLPVNNGQAVIMMLRALKHYQNEEYPQGEAAESTAVRWVTEEHRTSTAPVVHPLQVLDQAPLNDPCDYLD